MQSQMEAKLASMNLKSPAFAGSPTTRNFSIGSGRASSTDNFLSPDAANVVSSSDAANTLAQQRAKLKASNAAHRISAPALASSGADGRTTWGSGAPQLSQVAERSTSPAQEITIPTPAANSRPKSTDFSGVANAFRSPRAGGEIDALSPMVGDSWASMVNTPLIPMFNKKDTREGQNFDAATNKLTDWAAGSRVPLMEDPKKYRRASKTSTVSNGDSGFHGSSAGDEGTHAGASGQRPGGLRSVSANNTISNNNGAGSGGWNNLRSPALSSGSSRLAEEGQMHSGVSLGGFNMGLGSPGMGLSSASMLGGMPMSPFNMNMNMLNMAAMGMSPEAQLLAAQMAAAGQFGSSGLSFGMAALQQQQQMAANQRNLRSARSPGGKSSVTGRGDKKEEEDVDPKILEDVPAWLRTLRLHKYTPNFEGMSWRDMVVLDEAQLEAKGVAALGARRKMLKTFEIVRKKLGVEMPAGSTTTTTSA
jgi:SAM domain (Sterile alpha motif)